MMPPRSVDGRLSSHSTKRTFVRLLGNKLKKRLSVSAIQFALPLTIRASDHIKEPKCIKSSQQSTRVLIDGTVE